MTDENLVDEFSDLIRKYFDTPKVFADSAGWAISSALLGPYFFCPMVPKEAGKSNLFMILSSLPGRFRRSTVLACFDKVYGSVYRTEWLDEVTDEYVSGELKKPENKERSSEEIRKNLSSKQKADIEYRLDEKIDHIIIGEGSLEGMIDHIEEAKSREYIITSREMGGMFQKIFDKNSYENNVGTLLSMLYYGEGFIMHLSSRGGKKGGRRVPPGLFVTMLGGMQEFKLYIGESAIRQGFARRPIIVFVPKADDYKYPINEDRTSFEGELNDFIEKVIERRKIIRDYVEKINGRPITMMIHPQVEKEINEFDRALAMKLDASPTLENITKQSGWEQLFKLSFCYEIAKNKKLSVSETDKGTFVETLIMPDSYKRARAFLDVVYKNSKGEIDGISDVPDKSVNIRIPSDRLFNLALEQGSNGIRVRELLQSTGWYSEYAWKIALELKDLGRLKIESRPGKTKPSTYFIAITEDQKAEGDDFAVPK